MGTCNFGLSFNFGSNLPKKYKETEEDRNFLFSVIETVGKEKYIIKTVKREIMNGLSNSQTNSIIDEEALKYVSSGEFGKAAEEYKKLMKRFDFSFEWEKIYECRILIEICEYLEHLTQLKFSTISFAKF